MHWNSPPAVGRPIDFYICRSQVLTAPKYSSFLLSNYYTCSLSFFVQQACFSVWRPVLNISKNGRPESTDFCACSIFDWPAGRHGTTTAVTESFVLTVSRPAGRFERPAAAAAVSSKQNSGLRCESTITLYSSYRLPGRPAAVTAAVGPCYPPYRNAESSCYRGPLYNITTA